MQNVSRDNLVDQLSFMISEVRRRPKEAFFAVPEFALVQIDEGWQKQVAASNAKRLVRLQKEAEKRLKKEGKQEGNI